MQSKLTHNNDVRLVNRWRRIVLPNGSRILVNKSGFDPFDDLVFDYEWRIESWNTDPYEYADPYECEGGYSIYETDCCAGGN